jgi:ABC-type sugar transport system ATPase subunit
MAGVTLKDVSKIYEGGVKAVDNLSLDIHDREFVVLVGPSGCGKSTTLRMVAGLEEISSGTISIGDRVVNDIPPKDRDIAMVFQSYALYPHMTVYENMAFALKLRKTPKAVMDEKVRRAAKILLIESLLDRKPRALSGGQRQRVALGRAIVRDPKCFLFDEPLSNLDAKLRVEMRAEIKSLHMSLSATTIYVTHDQEEAMTLGDRVVVMRDGVVQQSGGALEIYHHPQNRFVAARTGYTGEDGLELFVASDLAREVFSRLLDAGAGLGLLPAGLGARDTLRLEARLSLYGNDIDETTNPLEAGLGWIVQLDKPDFLGKAALLRVRERGPSRKLVGFEMTGRGIARHGYPLLDAGGAVVGICTSGGPSPTLGKSIGLGYLPLSLTQPGSVFAVDCRGKSVPAVVVKTPFYRRAR